jgi:pyruvate,orthophosphate dikinase
LRDRVIALTEGNPMLGHRGCRLLITYPEIAEMQARAILEAASEAAKKTGEPVEPEIMVPLVGMKSELDHVKATIDRTAATLRAENGAIVDYTVGTMIELPRAALRALEIAESADFFSFGTNDLTQTTFGISRDDAAGFIGAYQEIGLIDADPFSTLDIEGVGVLVRVAANEGRKAKPELKLGICGEHGGDPASIAFCDAVGLDYVSCSPFRVPIARLAAAQAALAGAQSDTV